jgi:hypothetical protein
MSQREAEKFADDIIEYWKKYPYGESAKKTHKGLKENYNLDSPEIEKLAKDIADELGADYGRVDYEMVWGNFEMYMDIDYRNEWIWSMTLQGYKGEDFNMIANIYIPIDVNASAKTNAMKIEKVLRKGEWKENLVDYDEGDSPIRKYESNRSK